MVYEIVEGWSGPIDIDLLSQGAVPSGTMAGMSCELILRDLSGNTLSTSGDVSITDPVNWTVRYSPDVADLVAGVYHGRVKVTDSGGLVTYFPSGAWDIWQIRTEG